MLFIVRNAPPDLRQPVAVAGQRHDEVVIDLRDGRTVATEALLAELIGRTDHGVDALRILFQPGKQGRAEVEADPRVVVHNAHDLVFLVHNARRPIGRITLRADAFVPVVVRRR